jgi:MOSC domain-containing protein YiiM
MGAVQPGRVVSVNVAVVHRGSWAGRVGRSGIDKRPVAGPVRVEVGGVDGDTVCDTRDHGGPDQAVYAYSTDDLAFWTGQLQRAVEPGNVGENLTVDGVDCAHAVVGERWQVGDAVLRVTGPRTPCRVFAGFLDVPDLIKRFFAAGRPGAYLAVVHPAAVSAGDVVTVRDRPTHGVTVADVLAAYAGRRELLPRIAEARDDLGSRGRAWLDGVLRAGGRRGPVGPESARTAGPAGGGEARG